MVAHLLERRSSQYEMLHDVTADPAPRAALEAILRDIVPLDALEAEHRASSIAWVRSGGDVYRTRKPDVPPKHLVAYFAVVDVEAERILLVDHINAGLWLPAGGHVEPDED